MKIWSILLKGWNVNVKTIAGVLNLLLLFLVLPGTTEALQNALIRASDGQVYEIHYTVPADINTFNIRSLNGNIPSRDIVAELYISSLILNRPPTYWDIYKEDNKGLRNWVDSESKHTANWNKWHTAATFVGSVSASALSSVITGAIKITTSLIKSEVVQSAIQALTTITIVFGDEEVFTQAYTITIAYVLQAENKKQIFDDLVLYAGNGTEININDIKSAYNELFQAHVYVGWVHWMMNEYLVLPDRWERLWNYAKTVFPLTALGQFFASAGENIADLRQMNQLFGDSVERITQQATSAVDDAFSEDAIANVLSNLDNEGFFDRKPPIVVDTIDDLELMIGDEPLVRDVKTKFIDPNGDQLKYSIEQTDENVAGIGWILLRPTGESKFRSFLEITPKNLGTTDVTITATDPYGLSATLSFTITVTEQAPYEPPEAVGSIDPHILTLGSGATTEDVEQNFNCSNPLIFNAASNPSGIVTTSVSDSIITITPISAGITTVVVTARDTVNTALTAIQTISVSVRQTSAIIVHPPNNDPPFNVPVGSNPRAEGLRNGVVVYCDNLAPGNNLNVRNGAGTNYADIGDVTNGDYGEIIDGPRSAGGYTWWEIEWTSKNLEGWSIEEDLNGFQLLFRRPPDLAIYALGVSDRAVSIGEEIELEVDIRNNGPGESAATDVYFYYHSGRRNYNLEQLGKEKDLRGAWKLSVPSLWESGREELTLTVDAPTTPDDYYYGAFLPSNLHIDTDYRGHRKEYIAEADNNFSEVKVEVTGGPPDYIVQSIWVDEATLDPGEEFTLYATVHNQGLGASTSRATLDYYRSSNARISENDTWVDDDRVSGIDTNKTHAVDTTLSAPTEPGVYYYGACVSDVRNESDPNNNCSAAVTITVRDTTDPIEIPDSPDLVVSLSANTTLVDPNEFINLEAIVRNQGKADASSSTTLHYYVSSDATISPDDETNWHKFCQTFT